VARPHPGEQRVRAGGLAALLIVGTLSGCGGATGASSARGARFSPYADVSLSPPLNLAQAQRATGLRAVDLAFVVGSGRGCVPSWGGGLALDTPAIASEITRLRATGAAVALSFGGRDGPDLATRCPSPAALAGAYARALDAYGARRADFDIEGSALANGGLLDRRARAIAVLQAHERSRGRPLAVTLTLPGAPDQGLTAAGVNAVRAAQSAGVAVSEVNVLAMDYGDGAAPSPAGRMGAYAAQTAMRVHVQLRPLLPGLADRALWARQGVTVMAGVNDVSDEVFTPADVTTLLAFGRRVGLGGVSEWSLPRDRPCPPGSPPRAQPDCSGLAQAPFAFARRLVAYR